MTSVARSQKKRFNTTEEYLRRISFYMLYVCEVKGWGFPEVEVDDDKNAFLLHFDNSGMSNVHGFYTAVQLSALRSPFYTHFSFNYILHVLGTQLRLARVERLTLRPIIASHWLAGGRCALGHLKHSCFLQPGRCRKSALANKLVFPPLVSCCAACLMMGWEVSKQRE